MRMAQRLLKVRAAQKQYSNWLGRMSLSRPFGKNECQWVW